MAIFLVLLWLAHGWVLDMFAVLDFCCIC